jgi:hypothetical protein
MKSKLTLQNLEDEDEEGVKRFDINIIIKQT